MQITKEVIYHIAELAKLYITEEECEKLREEMGAVIAFADELGRINVDEIGITEHITENVNVFREDVVCPSFDRDVILANAPEKYAGCYKVPKIME